jgi:hypothetical protein
MCLVLEGTAKHFLKVIVSIYLLANSVGDSILVNLHVSPF